MKSQSVRAVRRLLEDDDTDIELDIFELDDAIFNIRVYRSDERVWHEQNGSLITNQYARGRENATLVALCYIAQNCGIPLHALTPDILSRFKISIEPSEIKPAGPITGPFSLIHYAEKRAKEEMPLYRQDALKFLKANHRDLVPKWQRATSREQLNALMAQLPGWYDFVKDKYWAWGLIR